MELMQAAVKQAPLEKIWRGGEPGLRGYIRRKVADEMDVDDILQEVFIKMQQRLHQLRDDQKVTSWLYQIARNAVVDYYRERQKERRLAVTSFDEEDGPAAPDLTHAFAQWLPVAIATLPDKYREAIYLTEIEGLSQRELAERLGISYSGAKSRVQRGREKLKVVIDQCCKVYTDRYGNVLDYHRRRAPEKPCDKNCKKDC